MRRTSFAPLPPTNRTTMAESPPVRAPSTHRRTFGPDESAVDVEDSPGPSQRPSSYFDHRRQPGRGSISHSNPRPSALRWRGTIDDDELPTEPSQDKPAIPSALQNPREEYSTPLPTLSMIVLSIVCLPRRNFHFRIIEIMIDRLCWENSCRQMFPPHFCYSW